MKREISLLACGLMISGAAMSQFWKTSDPIRLSGTVNTDAEESIPVFSGDNSKLYFVRTYDPSNHGGEYDQDIWVSERQADGSYGNCERVNSLNNKYNNAVQSAASKGVAMYLLNAYEGKKDLQKGLAVSRFESDKWQTPEKVQIPGLDIEGEYYGFFVSKDEKVIIISYQGEGSLGLEDLYVSTKGAGGWSTPQHMGAMINSKGYEISPFLSPSNDTLFFSSNGFGGQGDADIFYSVRQGSGWDQWSRPENLGNVINSPKFDAHFSYSGDQAIWSSNRDGELSDIYIIKILTPPPVTIACTGSDVTTNGGNDGRVDATVEGGVPPFKFEWSNGSTGEDLNGVIKGEYSVTVTDAVGQTATCKSPVSEPPIPAIVNFEFKHMFGYNKNEISTEEGKLREFLDDVEEQIAKTVRKMNNNVYSTASNVPTRTFRTNDNLAKKRADNMDKMLTKYFKEKNLTENVEIEIISAKVDGPKYEKDPENIGKYEPYQFVVLKTE